MLKFQHQLKQNHNGDESFELVAVVGILFGISIGNDSINHHNYPIPTAQYGLIIARMSEKFRKFAVASNDKLLKMTNSK